MDKALMKASRDVETLVHDLWDTDEAVRDRAFNGLLDLGACAVEPLLKALEKDDTSESFFEYENQLLRKALVAIGEPAFEALVEALRSQRMGRAEIKALMFFRDDRVVEPLIEAAVSTQRSLLTRGYAIDALGYIKPDQAFEQLLSLLQDENVFIRGHAARALGEYRDQRVLGPIKEALEHPSESQFMDWRRSAEIAIRRIEDPSYEGDDPGFFDQYQRFFGDVFG